MKKIKRTLVSLFLMTFLFGTTMVFAATVNKSIYITGGEYVPSGYMNITIYGDSFRSYNAKGYALTSYPGYYVRAYIEGVDAYGNRIGSGSAKVEYSDAKTVFLSVPNAYHFYSSHQVDGYKYKYYSTYPEDSK